MAIAVALLAGSAGQLSLVGAAEAAAAAATVNVYDNFVPEHGAGKGTTSITVGLSERLDNDVTVTASTVNGTATAPADFTAVTTSVLVPAGQDHVTFDIPVLDDTTTEADEKFTVTLSAPVGATLGDATATVIIVDDESAGAPSRNCDDGNVYTTDQYDSVLGYCTHTLNTGADLDGDKSVAAWVGGADCDDTDPAVAPKFEDIAGDGIDNNCDGLVDGVGTRDCTDDNPYTKDRYKAKKSRCTHEIIATADLDKDTFVGAWAGGADCNDDNKKIYPGAIEKADGVDSDCDGLDVPGTGEPVTEGVRTIEGIGEPMACPPSADCQPVMVDCMGLPSARAYFATSDPTVTPRGTIVMFLGSEGTGFYDGDDEFVPSLNDEGFALARINWLDGWNNTLPTGPDGLSTAACRTAQIVDYAYDTLYEPMGLNPANMVCGFCVTGNSAGALQAGYILARYGMESTIDATIMGGGPIPTMIDEACLEPGGDDTYAARDTVVDYAYGAIKGSKGPCAEMDESYQEIWQADSLVGGGGDFYYPSTRVNIFIGGLDNTSAPAHATAYYQELLDANTPIATYEIIPTAGHGLSAFLGDPAAQEAVTEAFLWEP